MRSQQVKCRQSRERGRESKLQLRGGSSKCSVGKKGGWRPSKKGGIARGLRRWAPSSNRQKEGDACAEKKKPKPKPKQKQRKTQVAARDAGRTEAGGVVGRARRLAALSLSLSVCPTHLSLTSHTVYSVLKNPCFSDKTLAFLPPLHPTP